MYLCSDIEPKRYFSGYDRRSSRESHGLSGDAGKCYHGILRHEPESTSILAFTANAWSTFFVRSADTCVFKASRLMPHQEA